MRTLLAPLEQLQQVEEINRTLGRAPGMLQISGCIDSQKLHFIYGLDGGFKRKVIVTYSEQKARELLEEYRLYDRNAFYFPAKDLLFYQADIQGNVLVRHRMEVVRAILEDRAATIITTVDGCMDYLPPLSNFAQNRLTLTQASEPGRDALTMRLAALGYERVPEVTAPGQFAVRGDIVDIFSMTEEQPYRIEFWGDEIDSIRSFDADSQRSLENLEEVIIDPARELVLSDGQINRGVDQIRLEMQEQWNALRGQMKTEEAHRLKRTVDEICETLLQFGSANGIDSLITYFLPKAVSFVEYHDLEQTLFILDEPNRLIERAQAVEKEFSESMTNRMEKGSLLAGQCNVLFSTREVCAKLNRRHTVGVSALDPSRKYWDIQDSFLINAKSINSYQGEFGRLAKELSEYCGRGYRVLVLAPSGTRAKRLAENLCEYELNSFYSESMDRVLKPGEIMTAKGILKKGFEYPQIKFVVLSESDIFGKERKRKKSARRYEGERISSFYELKVGDYVVHEKHGIGIYQGLENLTVDGVSRDYIKISYRDGGNLYILATQLDVIQKFSGSEGKAPKLNKLGTQEWTRTKSRVRSAVQDIAKELVTLYAARQERNGFVFGSDTVWQKEFEEMFPFEETEDQLSAIEATKRDMESTKIMDRLICGDVGSGKTEVAIRAAFKAVQENKQVVFLVPTTILAQQHYNTFMQRMKDFPVRVDLLCRFRTSMQQKKTIEDLRKGLVDIVIGTHRVLSADVTYKDLGLLIIDEEQRFGVTHKEKIKQLRTNIDVLTLTATPIPRTLHMSLIGIRDMSVLEEAPIDRVAIQTYVMEYEEEMVREAISRELSRNGQVYYVFNRVQGIEDMTSTIARLVPEAEVAYAHGQMPERQLERVMYDFINKEIDVLVSTTIIETGLDIPNVNTMIIHDADTFGLSQLYQLRGRVGRSNRTAYAFLLYRRNKMLKETAEKRLQAIKEFTELGSGIKIAMRDLEIRGAGNLLGANQHGNMEAVGYDLYCKMLSQAVREQKGDMPLRTFETVIDMDLDAYIPERYIPNEFQKLDMYKRIAGIENEEEYRDMQEELTDRFGDLPDSVLNLLYIACVKAMAHALYVSEVSVKGDVVRLQLEEEAPLQGERLPELLKVCYPSLSFKNDAKPYFLYHYRTALPSENRLPRRRTGSALPEKAGASKSRRIENRKKELWNLLERMKEYLLP